MFPAARFSAVLLGVLIAVASAGAAPTEAAIEPGNRIMPEAPAWQDLVALFARQPDASADFEERRYFPFRREPVVLKGEVRVSRSRGLSLRYTAPEERVVVVDAQGMTTKPRTAGEMVPPQAAAGVAALLHILRLDFTALEKDFESYGRRDGAAWSIVLVPRDPATRKAMGNIHVAGEAAVVRTIELRRSAKQHIDISMSAPRSPVTFTADEVQRYFR